MYHFDTSVLTYKSQLLLKWNQRFRSSRFGQEYCKRYIRFFVNISFKLWCSANLCGIITNFRPHLRMFRSIYSKWHTVVNVRDSSLRRGIFPLLSKYLLLENIGVERCSHLKGEGEVLTLFQREQISGFRPLIVVTEAWCAPPTTAFLSGELSPKSPLPTPMLEKVLTGCK